MYRSIFLYFYCVSALIVCRLCTNKICILNGPYNETRVYNFPHGVLSESNGGTLDTINQIPKVQFLISLLFYCFLCQVSYLFFFFRFDFEFRQGSEIKTLFLEYCFEANRRNSAWIVNQFRLISTNKQIMWIINEKRLSNVDYLHSIRIVKQQSVFKKTALQCWSKWIDG